LRYADKKLKNAARFYAKTSSGILVIVKTKGEFKRFSDHQSYPLMKIAAAFVLLLFPVVSFSQQLVMASNEPTVLYAKANRSLNLGDTKMADQIFRQVIEFYEQEGRVKEVSEGYLGMALAFAFNGHYRESIRYHKKALRAHHRYRAAESDDAIRFNLGLAYQLAGKERRAQKYLN
jgi:tetratricopeptide (TPR) repeat protein